MWRSGTRGGQRLIGAMLLMGAMSVLAACGGGGIESDELSSVVEQSVAAALAAAVPDAAPAGPSAAEISAMVQQAVETAAPEGVSAAEIGVLVEAAVSAASGPTVSAAEIESLVRSAVEQAAAGAATPLSASEIQAIVSAAIEAIPEPEPMAVAAPEEAMEMETIVARGTHRANHNNTWQGMEKLDPVSPTAFARALLWDQLTTQDFETGEIVAKTRLLLGVQRRCYTMDLYPSGCNPQRRHTRNVGGCCLYHDAACRSGPAVSIWTDAIERR